MLIMQTPALETSYADYANTGTGDDWKAFWNQHSKDLFCWAMGYNAAEKDIRNYRPNHDVFREMLPKGASVLDYIALDCKKMPAFAIVYLKTQNSEDLNQILSLEFNDCFELIVSEV